MKKYNSAFIIGKFLPPHKGHTILIDFALSIAKNVTVAVEQQKDESIDVDQRALWLKDYYQKDNIDIKPLYGSFPPSPPGDEVGDKLFWEMWKKTICSIAPNIDVLISADSYGRKLAQDQNIDWMPVDRQILPISATLFKEKPWDRYDWLIPPAKISLLRRLVIVGAESTGKSVLAQKLSNHINIPTVFVPEFAQNYLKENSPRKIDAKMLEKFFLGHIGLRQSLYPLANRWVVEDTHMLTTAIWAEYLGFEKLAQDMYSRAKEDKPHHIILSSIKGALWHKDIHRPKMEDLHFFEDKFKELLQKWGWSYSLIEGDWQERERQAFCIRDDFLEKWQNANFLQWTKN